MAYMSQENKKSKEPAIKAILKKYGIKGYLSVRHHSTLVLTIKEGKIDFIGNYNQCGADDPYSHNSRFEPAKDYIQVNEYHYKDHFSGTVKECLGELLDVMEVGNYDNSDIQVDHFDIGWYTDINIGEWDKPYKLIN
jgi:hypothetical protein